MGLANAMHKSCMTKSHTFKKDLECLVTVSNMLILTGKNIMNWDYYNYEQNIMNISLTFLIMYIHKKKEA